MFKIFHGERFRVGKKVVGYFESLRREAQQAAAAAEEKKDEMVSMKLS